MSARQQKRRRERTVQSAARQSASGSAGVGDIEEDGLFHRDILQHDRVSPAGRAAVPAGIRGES